jgi:FkbM family methyltransferase
MFSTKESLQRIKALGVRPKTVFDIGVANGTPGLYGVFDDVRYVLIDPLQESVPFMERIVQTYPGSLSVTAAAGRAAGEGRLVVTESLSGSSFTLSPRSGTQRAVPMVTVDGMVEAHDLQGPHLIKVDVQGYELEVLAGAERTLPDAVAIIAEVSLWADRKNKARGMVELLTLMNWLRDRGFVLYDVSDLVRRKLDGAITEMDFVFAPADGPLRQVSRYKSEGEALEWIEKRRKEFGAS